MIDSQVFWTAFSATMGAGTAILSFFALLFSMTVVTLIIKRFIYLKSKQK